MKLKKNESERVTCKIVEVALRSCHVLTSLTLPTRFFMLVLRAIISFTWSLITDHSIVCLVDLNNISAHGGSVFDFLHIYDITLRNEAWRDANFATVHYSSTSFEAVVKFPS